MIRAHAAEFDFAGWNGAATNGVRVAGFLAAMALAVPTTVYAWMQATGLVNDHVAGCFRRNEV